MKHLSAALGLVALSYLSFATAQNVSISLPTAIPANATVLDPRLCSMSLEFQSLEYYAGELGSPNQFTQNVVKNIVDRVGQPPAVRVGGNTQDRTYYDPSVLAVRLPAGNASVPNPTQMQIYVGPNFFKLAKNLPANTLVTFGVNLKFNNLTDAIDETKAIFAAFPGGKAGKVVLERIEIGNEPDFYFDGVDSYADRWTEFAQNISQAVNLVPGKGPHFQAGDFAGHSASNFSITRLLQTDIVSGDTGARINTVAQHNYMGDGATGTVSTLLDKSLVRSSLAKFKSDVAYANSKGYTYILGETNSFYNGGATNASNTGATAIWATDYSLQAATLNISRTYYHNNIAAGYQHYYPAVYNIWEPVGNVQIGNITTTKPQIQPQYHAFLVVAEAIGKTGNSRVAELSVGSSQVSAYGIWEHGELARVVVINQQPWTYSSTGTRPVTTVQLQGLTSKKATVKTLYVPYADIAQGLTWGGQNFATESGLPSGKVVTQNVKNGQIITLATSVNLVTFK
ncbi:hypothetical protein NQZ79_g8886 [Umbelopsis isabellina]|nr:hypothetical protein NQZ79_g8886 [Umbelopsis isabellina]